METHPEQVEVEMADINDNFQLLQSLAKRVEQEEGRGELKVSYLLICRDYAGCEMTLVFFSSLVLFCPSKCSNMSCFQVVTAPESLCILLTGKSYHWCKYRCMPVHCFLVWP